LARRILLADDSVTAQNMGRRILSDAGYEVITVNNGSAALKKIAEQAPDLIILDVYMPGYGGLEVCQRLKENGETARIPVLLTVGKLEPFKPDEARRVRADAFIVKPFEASELLAALTKLEDKIVPQADPHKTGKAKSLGPLDSKGEKFGNSDSGWKNRLNIPPGGKGRSPESMEGGERQAVELEQSEDSKKKEVVAHSEGKLPDNIPADITAEEISAIKAAAAAVETKSSVVAESTPVANAAKEILANNVSGEVRLESASPEDATKKPVSEDSIAKDSAGIAADSPFENAKLEISGEKAEPEISAALASLIPANTANEQVHEEIPATIASAVSYVSGEAVNENFSGPRWVAQEVTIMGDDATFILEREMQKAYAAMAAYDAGHLSSPVNENSTNGRNTSAAVIAIDSRPDLKSESEIKAPFPSINESAAQLEAVAKISIAVDEPASVKSEAYAAAASSGSLVTEAQVDNRVVGASKISEQTGTSTETNSREDQLTAAWEKWQTVRETVLNSDLASQITKVASAGLESNSSTESLAAAASDEKQASMSLYPSNPTTIASIVDSVLAELKPKLVEEIARQLNSEKKSK
jgi:CheY-like chemotaxis protein